MQHSDKQPSSTGVQSAQTPAFEPEQLKPPAHCTDGEILRELLPDDWEVTEEYESGVNGEVPFTTARRNKANLIVYKDYVGYAVFRTCAYLVAANGLTEKAGRVALFQSILYNTREPEDF